MNDPSQRGSHLQIVSLCQKKHVDFGDLRRDHPPLETRRVDREREREREKDPSRDRWQFEVVSFSADLFIFSLLHTFFTASLYFTMIIHKK